MILRPPRSTRTATLLPTRRSSYLPSLYAPPPAAVGPNEIPPLPAPPKSTVDLETKYPLLTADQSVARMIDQVPTFTIESLAFFDGRYRLMGAVYEQK